MFVRYPVLAVAVLLFALSCAHVSAQDQPDARKQLFAELTAIEKIARERPLEPAEWEKLAKLEDAAAEQIRLAEKKQAELDQSGKAELYRLFVRASRLEAAEKTKTITPEQSAEKARIATEIFRLAEPLLQARRNELSGKKDAGEDLSLRETAILDGLTRWHAPAGEVTASLPDDPAMEAPRMDLQQLIWIEQIAIMETQGTVRRDLRLKDQLAEIYRWIERRAESQEGDGREEAKRRLSLWKAKRRE